MRVHLLYVAVFTALLFASGSSAVAQKGAALQQMAADELWQTVMKEEWQLAKKLTLAYAEAMPANKFGFRPQDSIRNFAQQLLHLAQVNAAMVANGTGAERLFPKGLNLEQRSSAQAKDSVMHFLTISFDYAISAIREMDATRLEEKIEDKQVKATRLGWLLKALVHLAHHRAQAAVYLRFAGIAPPKWME
jgi:uncharacterized damage-inducible protein DinB